MRLLSLCVVVTACSGTEDGAHLTFAVPADFAAASKVQIVLASAEDIYIETVDHQRVAPRDLAEESVVYYRQRASGGVIESHVADGFAIRIAPNPEKYPDDKYIPFVLAFDSSDALVGVATFRSGDDPKPQPIEIRADVVNAYTLTLDAVTASEPDRPLEASQVALVDCAGNENTTWRSGFAWRLASGLQIRVLLPDTATDPASDDAMSRLLDLDCDGREIKIGEANDCDDLRVAYHRGAAEACDGEDTNCDFQQFWSKPCQTPGVCANSQTMAGFTLCNDRDGSVGTCQSDAECLCQGTGTQTCAKCVLEYSQTAMAGQVMPCQPAIGQITLEECYAGGCTVEVIAASPGWMAHLANNITDNFTYKLTNVGKHPFVKAKLTAGPTATLPLNTARRTVGQFQLAVTDPMGATRLVSYALELALDGSSQCAPQGSISMFCTP